MLEAFLCFIFAGSQIKQSLEKMNPIKQTINNDMYGNCLQACIASVMEKPLDHVPNFMLFEDHWWSALIMWFGSNGYGVDFINNEAPPVDGKYYVASLKFKRHGEGISHAVVMMDDEVVHDPFVNINYKYSDSVINGYYILSPSQKQLITKDKE